LPIKRFPSPANRGLNIKLQGKVPCIPKVQLKDMSEEDVLIQLKFKRKILITLLVKLYNEDQKLVLSAEFDWFITLPK
jgi:hypothetical protein